MNRSALAAIIAILALVDAAIHFSLDVVLFHGQFLRNTLSEAFLLNCLGYLVLLALFLYGTRFGRGTRQSIDGLMIVFAAVTFLAWLAMGHPNPMGLGYLSKAVEVLLVATLIYHASTLGRTAVPSGA